MRGAGVRRLALARLRRIREAGDPSALRDLHARYKYLLMAHDPVSARALGRLAAEARSASFADACDAYARGVDGALATPAAPGGHVNALLHMFGYLPAELPAAERNRFLVALEAYRLGTGTLAEPVTLLRRWILQYDVAYLKPQVYFEPYFRRR